MIDVLIPLVLLLVLGYSIHRLVSRSGQGHHGKLKSELPVHRHPLSTRPGSSYGTGWSIEQSGLTWSLVTSGLNGIPSQIFDRRPERVKRAFKAFYELGSIFGVLGGVGAVGVTGWTLVQVWTAVWQEARSHAAEKNVGTVKILRRAIEHAVPSAASKLEGLQPLVPGISLPWSHVPTLLLALFVNQLIHELGHALCAGLDDITPSRFSLNLHCVMPSMAVHLPASVDYLSARAKMRLAASGPYHNLLVYGWLSFLVFSGAGQVLWVDHGDLGRVVQSVSSRSPLAEYIKPGRLITRLDDESIGGADDTWSEYLNSDITGDTGRGWCINQEVFSTLPDLPCDPASGKIRFEITDPESVDFDEPQTARTKCLHPNPILQIPSSKCPCPNSKWVCIRPLEAENVLRIRMKDSSYEGQVVLWQGDRRGVMEDVQIGRHGPRFLGSFVRWGAMFMKYMSTVSLSLFLFNLLPLPYTDGSQLMKALFSLKSKSTSKSKTISLRSPPVAQNRPLTARATRPSSSATTPTINIRFNPLPSSGHRYDREEDDEYEMEDGNGNRDGRDGLGRREEVWKRRLRRGVESGVMIMAAGWVLGWAMLALLRSS